MNISEEQKEIINKIFQSGSGLTTFDRLIISKAYNLLFDLLSLILALHIGGKEEKAKELVDDLYREHEAFISFPLRMWSEVDIILDDFGIFDFRQGTQTDD